MLQDAFEPYDLKYAKDFRDCLFRTSGVIAPAVELLKLFIENNDFDHTPVALCKLSFTAEEDELIKSGDLTAIISDKGSPLVKERIKYLGYRIVVD